MFDINTMKNKANNHNPFPRRTLSLAILVALTILAGGLVRQSAAQEPAPAPPIKAKPARVEVEPVPPVKPAPRFKMDLSSLDDLDLKMDLSSLDKLDLSFLDKMDFSFLDKMDFSFLDKMDFSYLDKLEKLPPLDKLDRLTQRGDGFGIGSG